MIPLLARQQLRRLLDRSDLVTLLQHDLTDRAGIILLVDTFYDAVRADRILGPIFNDTAKVDWGVHLPKMYDCTMP